MSDQPQLLSADPSAGTTPPMRFFAIVNGQPVDVPPDDQSAPGPPAGAPTLLSKDPRAGLAPSAPGAAADDQGVLGFAKHFWDQINPIPLGQLLPFPQALGGAGLDAPLKAADSILKAQGHLFDRAKASYEQGDHWGAAVHALHWLLPLIGPILDKAGDELNKGQLAAGLGDTTGLGAALFGMPKAAAAVERRLTAPTTTAAPTPRLTPEELASNAFAGSEGIPLDAATATGSRFIRGVQKGAGESFLGSMVGEKARAAQEVGLGAAGERLAGQVAPGAVMPEGAGSTVIGAIQDVVRNLHAEANDAYGRLRAFEERPEHAGGAQSASMPMAVDMRHAKQALQPLYERLKREGELAPLMGAKATALRAIDRLMTGPDQAPLSIADAALSDLKALSRSDDMPELRGAGKGAAAYAVKQLDEAVQLRAASAGDDIFDALRQGRQATRAKYEAGEVLDQLADEPVKTFDRLTAPRDANVDLLRQVEKVAPKSLPALGRAKLQQWLDKASERGRFDHADRLYAEWQKLGPATKRLLFGDPKLIDQLDEFFLLAKRIGENPNPSGTTPTGLKVGEAVGLVTHPLVTLPVSLTMGGLAKILYSPKGVQALTNFMRASVRRPVVGGGAVSSASRGAALAQVATAAKAVGVDLPLAADRDEGR